MQARFLHFADCHLGYKQYNHKERLNDFARAFLDVIETAIAARVDFVILAGDLFQKRAIDALTLNQAMHGLERLKAANIPCIAVEGNHENAYFIDYLGWVEFLAARQLLTLLTPVFAEGKPQLAPFQNRQGSYIDPLPGVRIHGLRYFGAGTAAAIEAYAEALAAHPNDEVEYTIFMAHAGLEGVLPDAGGLSHRQWGVLRPHVDYLALGHIHKPYDFEDWIYNPGSPETCSMTESAWPERGYYLVEIDTDTKREGNHADDVADSPRHTATLGANKRRTFHRLRIKTDLYTSPDALHQHCQEYLQRRARDLGVAKLSRQERPVVELQLTGVLPFDRSALDLDPILNAIIETFDPLIPLVKNLTQAAEFAVSTEEGVSRPELERQVLTDLFARDARFNPQSDEWSRLAISLKQLALGGAAPETIVQELASEMDKLETQ